MPETITTALESIPAPIPLDTRASVTWSTLAFPGDEFVNALIDDFGPVAALEAVFGTDPVVPDLAVTRVRKRLTGDWSVRLVEETLAASEELGLTILTPADPSWPAGLVDLRDAAPFALWVRGDSAALQRPGVVVTGESRMTPYGLETSLELAMRGYTVLSGGGTGVDTAALLATIATRGTPIAVTDTSLDHAPSKVLDRTATVGVVVSEIPPAAPPPSSGRDGARGVSRSSSPPSAPRPRYRSNSGVAVGHDGRMGRCTRPAHRRHPRPVQPTDQRRMLLPDPRHGRTPDRANRRLRLALIFKLRQASSAVCKFPASSATIRTKSRR